MTIIAVTGLTKEAKIVGVADVVAVAGGGDGDGLAAKLDALHGDLRGVISIGLAGALSPHLKVGERAKTSDALPFFAHVQKNKNWMLDFKGVADKWLIVKGWLLHQGHVTD